MGGMSDSMLPLGFLFFGIMVFGFLRKKAGNVVARSQYPALAERLGLVHKPSPYRNGIGRLEGVFDGYSVSVDPDDQRRIFVRFANSPRVELHSYVHNKRPSAGQKNFRPPSGTLASQFKTAQASPELIEAFSEDEALPALIKPLKFIRELKTVSVTASGVMAVFDYGNPPFIPTGIVEDVLPRLTSLASVFEPRSM